MSQSTVAGLVRADVDGQGLPSWRTSFVGRRDELARAEALLSNRGLVTITGPAGVGKTRLAAEAASRVRAAAGREIAYVSLQEIGDGGHLPGAILAAMNRPQQGDRSVADQAVDALREFGGLLVLDNLEHLLDDGVPLVMAILQACHTLTMMVTSRERLGLAGEQILALTPLDPAAEALDLLADRVRAARPELGDGALRRPGLARLCARLDGLPLAVELAAAQIATDPDADWAEALGDGLSLTGQDGGEPRHSSLRAAIDWGYRLLRPDVQEFFRAAAVFRGSWSLEAAEAVSDDPFAIDHLEALHRASLIVVESRGDVVRYRLLEAMRAFAAESLVATGLADEVAAKHYQAYLATAQECSQALEHDGESPALLARLETEQENLRAAMAWSLKQGAHAAFPLAAALWRFWLVRGYWREAYATLETILDDPALDAAQRIQALGWLGHLAYRLGRNPEAVERLQASLALAEPAGDRSACGHALNELGKVAWASADYQRARELFEQALVIRRELDNPWSIAATLANLGAVTAAEGDVAAARELVAEGLAIRERIEDRRGVAASLNNLGVLAYQASDLAEATALLERSTAMRRELGDQPGLASCLNDAGSVALARGDLEAAAEKLTESLALRRRLGDRRGVARTLNNLGIIATQRQDYAAAAACYDEAMRIQDAIGDVRGVAMTANNLGDVGLAAGDRPAAKRHFRRALDLAAELGDRRGVALAELNLGHVAAAAEDWSTALARYQAGLDLSHELDDRWLQAVGHQARGTLALRTGALADARIALATSLELRCQLADLAGLAETLTSAAEALRAGVDPAAAERLEAAAQALQADEPIDWRGAVAHALRALR